MSFVKRIILSIFQYLPILILVWVIGLLLLSNSSERKAIQLHSIDTQVTDDNRVMSLEFDDTAPSLQGLRQFSELRRLSFRKLLLDEPTVIAIRSTENLAALTFVDCDMEDHQLYSLFGGLPQLEELTLSGSTLPATFQFPDAGLKILKLNGCTWVNDDTMASIGGLSDLQSLDLSGTSVTEAGLQALGKLRQLNELNLSSVNGLSDQIFETLTANTSLRRLAMSSSRFSLRAASKFQQTNPQVRLCVPLRDFAELRHLVPASQLKALNPSDPGPFYYDGIKSVFINNKDTVDFSVLPAIPNLEQLSCYGRQLTKPQIRYISKTTGLTSLDLSGCSISDPEMKEVSQIEGLMSLSVRDTNLTDDALTHIAKLAQLRELDLENTAVTKSGLALLNECRKLEFIQFPSDLWSDELIRSLHGLPKLFRIGNDRFRNLDLANSSVSVEGLNLLSELPLEFVRLNNLPLDDSCLECLSNWRKLRSLDLSGTNVTCESLNFTTHAQLSDLRLSGTRISDASMWLPDTISRLALSKTEITGETFAKLSLPNLVSLELAETRLSKIGLKQVLKLPIQNLDLTGVPLRELPAYEGGKITNLSIHGNSRFFSSLPMHSIAASLQRLKLTNADAKHFDTIRQLDSIAFLTLIDCSFGANSFERITSHPNLAAIHLKNCNLTREAINELGQIKQLTIVRSSSQLDELRQLKARRPKLQIEDTALWEDD